jgi:hypothetical protein
MKKVIRQSRYCKVRIKYLIGCVILVSAFVEVTGQNCKPDQSVNDKFTRQRYDLYNYDLKGTWNILFNTTTNAVFSFAVKSDTQLVAVLTFRQSAAKSQKELNPLKISKGAEFYLANDAASVKLICDVDAVAKNKTDILNGNINQTLTAEFSLPITDLETFSKQVFDQVLITFDGMPGQKANIKKKDAAKMQTDALCLLAKFKK